MKDGPLARSDIQSVANLTPFDALPIEFTRLRDTLEHRQSQSGTAVHTSAGAGQTMVLAITAVTLPLLVALLLTTIRSIMGGVRQVSNRVREIAQATDERLKTGLQALAHGDFTVCLEVKTKPATTSRDDEFGEIERTTEHIRDTIIDCYSAVR